jgi:hypothetical protein
MNHYQDCSTGKYFLKLLEKIIPTKTMTSSRQTGRHEKYWENSQQGGNITFTK